MPLPTEQRLLRLEQAGKVVVVHFQQPRILDDADVEAVGAQLVDLVETAGRRHLLLHFGGVERLTIDLLGKLMTLHQKTQALGGRLCLCGLHADVYPIFETLGLPKLLHIFPDEKEALKSF
jgi:anti-anti-sigma factor